MHFPDSSIQLITASVKAISSIVSSIASVFKFLPRSLSNRSGRDRRSNQGRRHADNLAQRLRRGMWLQFHRDTGHGEFDKYGLDAHRRTKVKDSLRHEATKYEFRERHGKNEVSPTHALDLAINKVWVSLESAHPSRVDLRAVFIIEAIAEELYKNFDVTAKDKREGDRRSSSAKA
jgi:hypothetical protein